MLPRFTVAASDTMTHYDPLVALGFYVRQHDLLTPWRSRLQFAAPTHCAVPTEALFDVLRVYPRIQEVELSALLV